MPKDPAAATTTTVCVLGLGSIGLPLAVSLAEGGLTVLGVDPDLARLLVIREGTLPRDEPGLCQALPRLLEHGRLALAASPAPADVFVILTPSHDTVADATNHLRTLTHTLLPHLRPGGLILLESTTPPGATRQGLVAPLKEAGHTPGQTVHVAHSPERIAVGQTPAGSLRPASGDRRRHPGVF